MNNRDFKLEELPFSKKTTSISKINQEVLVLMKFIQTEPQVKNVNNKF